MKIFFLSGLGADKTAFNFLDLSFCEPVFIEWIEPLPNESLQQYALRLKEQFIPDDSIVIGLSFGGMLATEIAKNSASIKAVIISGAKTKYEIPVFYKSGKYFPLYKWLSGSAHQWFMLNAKWMFGLQNNETKKVYKTIINNSRADFNKWAIRSILFWKNIEIPNNVIHIHGTADKILPYKNVHAQYAIKDGEHLMVMDHAEELSILLRKILVENKE